jgi:hypothetical protein
MLYPIELWVQLFKAQRLIFSSHETAGRARGIVGEIVGEILAWTAFPSFRASPACQWIGDRVIDLRKDNEIHAD